MIDRKNEVVMKLLHYFILEKNYSPVVLQGADNEIWLENLEEEYKIIRLVSNYLHNNEQFEFDVFKTKKISDKIKKKTFSVNMNVISIYLDLGENVDITKENRFKNIYNMSLFDENDLDNYDFFTKTFGNIVNKLKFTEEGMELFLKITNDINSKNKKDAERVENIFKLKKPIITYTLIGLNVFIYLFSIIFLDYNSILDKYCLFGDLVRSGDYYRLVTSMFLHGDIFHLAFNCYALYVIGIQLESYLGKIKYLLIYLLSGIFGSFLSITLSSNPSIGASGAVFGLMGSLLYFGYHYRVYLGTVMRSQIIPLILINLLYGFMVTGIDNFAHIGGLVGGFIVTTALGVKYKSTKFEMINGYIVSILLLGFFIYINFYSR
ncbi:MAG: rhomboid family intramembrane serine protease [Bacilli bacterium]|nr:rhomboid family intramembrane serine protease [Bacilli bacterium]